MSRQLARETAFKMIFQMDVGKNPLEMAEYTMEEALTDGGISKSECKYILTLVSGVSEKKEELDEFMEAYSKGWALDRINHIEKSIIRLALYEIRYMDIPYEVSVNEAVELAKRYGEEDAYSFVNAILDNARPKKKDEEK